MESSQAETKRQELAQLQQRVAELQDELQEVSRPRWQAKDFYAAYYATSGFMLGIFGAATSLLVNIIGATFVYGDPLRLIRVYLTFPLGAGALPEGLRPEGVAAHAALSSDMTLAVGCCLYLAYGMLIGVPFFVLLGRYTEDSTWAKRMMVASVLGLAVWVINFYGILIWLQPLLFGGPWIVDNVPIWVAIVTHLVYGWTLAAVYPLGKYRPYQLETEKA